MAGDKEIKVTAAEFDVAIQNLIIYKYNFSSARDRIRTINDNMKKDWIGDGGTAFMLSAKVLEEEYTERINELEGEISDLQNTKASQFGLDSYLSNSIEGAIGGAASIVALEALANASSIQTSKSSEDGN